MAKDGSYDLVCFSHLRWNFVFQRPQHLLTRFAKWHRVFYVEEAEWHQDPDVIQVREGQGGVLVVVPLLQQGEDNGPATIASRTRALIDDLFSVHSIRRYVLWYYTPMALSFTDHLKPLATVYDCMDDLSGFAGAPPDLPRREAVLMSRANLVTVGGHTLFEAKRGQHRNIHLFPSSIDVAHFGRARLPQLDPEDQRALRRPRIGFAGVIDERMDLELVRQVAALRPRWEVCLLGPVAKIDRRSIPHLPNVHLLGLKSYDELPAYLSGWDVGILPFAHNSATRFISPTKTPEYLAAGLPVVSTSIRDVVRPYGEQRLVRIADDATTFVAAIEAALCDDRKAHHAAVDTFLATNSWDLTAQRMAHLLTDTLLGPRSNVSVTASLLTSSPLATDSA